VETKRRTSASSALSFNTLLVFGSAFLVRPLGAMLPSRSPASAPTSSTYQH